MFISLDRKVVKIVIRNRYRYFKQIRLTNKYIFIEDKIMEVFEQSIEVDIVKNRSKVYSLNISRSVAMIDYTNTQ